MKTSSYFSPKVKKQLDKFFDKASMTRLGKACGFILRKVQKITAYNFVVSPEARLLCCAKGKNTLTEWARQISLLSGQSVTKQALWERVHEGTVSFASSLVRQLLLKQAFHRVKSSLFSALKL